MQNHTCPPSGARILLIDQNHDALALLKSMLACKGYQVTTAVDGLDGLEKFRHGHFQLVLTGLSIPGMSGLELGRVVKQSAPSLPVALVTGIDFQPWPDHSPFDAIISKPFHFNEFRSIVDSLLRSDQDSLPVG